MLQNYFKIAIRNLLRYKLYSFINISGLAVGMASVILIMLFISHEINYDQFQDNGHRIYRILRETRSADGSKIISTGTSGGLGPALEAEFPEVEQSVRKMSWDDVKVRVGNKEFSQRFCLTDPNFFDLFTFPLVKGDPKVALQKPNALLLTEEMVQKYFGQEDPMGQTVFVPHRYYGGIYEITGVLKNIPKQSHMQFDFLTVPSNAQERASNYFTTEKWIPDSSFRPLITYVQLSENASARSLERKLPELMARYMGEQVRQQNTYYLQPFDRIYLYSEADYGPIYSMIDRGSPMGDIRQIYAFGAVAIFILLIACINFMNLTTARSVNRAREVGLRKVVGADRLKLIQQFIGETILLVGFAILIALVLVEMVLPAFNAFVHKNLTLDLHTSQIAALIGFTLLVGIGAGSYPAFFLSAFQPVAVLKGDSERGGAWLRKALVVFQFGISICLLIGTGVVYQQMQYISAKKLGFNKEQTLTLSSYASRIPPQIRRQEFLAHPDVLNITWYNFFLYEQQYETIHTDNPQDGEQKMYVIGCDARFLDTFDMQLVEGRNFSDDRPTDSIEGVILNETAVKKLGWTDPIGKILHWPHRPTLRVIGVVKDFHTNSLREEIKPVFLIKDYKFKYHTLRVKTENLPDVLAFLNEKWNVLLPGTPFEFTFVSQDLAQLYETEKRLGQLSAIFSLIAIFVSCLGVFGLATFTAEKRTKEIGIRKVLGATDWSIALNLSRDMIYLVAIANIIAWPIAYWGMKNWLQQFSYRIDLSVGFFVLSGCIAFVIALMTVGYQAFKATRANPIDSLRYE